MAGRLAARSAAYNGLVQALGDGVTTLGRDPDNTLVLVEDGISRHHAEIRWDGQQYRLHDCGSKNGTWLNGERLTAPQPLRHGDVISLPAQPPVELVVALQLETVTVPPEVLQAPRQPPPASGPAEPATEVPAGAELRIDLRTAEVWVRGVPVRLTAKEYQALAVLAAAAGALVSRQTLAEQVWPEYQGAVGQENIEQLIFRLRQKLEATPAQPRYLRTVRGLGYRLLR